MARFNIFYYLFAVLVVLAVAANARPASSEPDTGSVAGMPGMASELSGGAKQDDNAKAGDLMGDSEDSYMDDMEKALEAASKAAAKATPTSAGPRPTPGVPTTTAASKPSGNAQPQPSAHAASPSASPSAAAPQGMLNSLPLVGSLLGGLRF